MKKLIPYRLSVVSLLLLLCACIPVEKTPQLTFTPGTPFVVTGEIFDAGVFRVRYPAGWRVISGQASAPPSVIFVAPDDAALMVLAVGNIESPPILNTDAEILTETRTIELNGRTLTAYGTAPAAEWDSFMQTFEGVLASLES